MKKINVITLGCSKNTVDSEHLMAQLAAAGYTVTHDSDRTDAKVVVINTCGFIGDAKQESIDMILRAAAAKQTGKIERLFVVGCLSERYAEELRAELPEVDEFFGVKDWNDIVRALEATPRPALATERRLTTPKHYAYLKISEGCNWKCGYCAIPLIRGPHASVPMETLLEEARKLAAGGVRELIVIAQDTTYYGLDLYGKRRLAEREVNASVTRFEQAKYEGFETQDCLAMAALQLAISSVSLARSREVGSEDLRRLEALRDEIDEYLNRIETEKK